MKTSTSLLHAAVMLVALADLATAQTERLTLQTTKEGCKIQAPAQQMFAGLDPQGKPYPMKWEYSWSGACVGGTAFGPGLLRIQFSSGPTVIVEHKQLTVNAGFPIGYEYSRTESSPPSPFSAPGHVIFRHGNRQVAFTDGWGLATAPFAKGVSSVVLPDVVSVRQAVEFGYLAGTSGSVTLVRQFTVDATPSYVINERDKVDSRETPCPNPKELQSCLQLVESLGPPRRDEIIAFIRQAKPEVDAEYARVNQALAGSAAPATSTGTAAPPLKLDSLPVGALYAAADEAAAKGDKAMAREALRTLLRRFPDHPLAANAAQQLAALQGQ
jgi:hypothetical protein